MKRTILLFIAAMCLSVSSFSQDMIFSSLQQLRDNEGEMVTTLAKERRTIKQIMLSGGADYLISSVGNKSLSKYIKKRSYAVFLQDTLYVNCKRMRYKRYRFGNWFAPALRVGGSVFYSAQPLGQLASKSVVGFNASKLPGTVGDAIQASNLVYDRVVYELNLTTGISNFVGRERMAVLLSDHPQLLEAFLAEDSEDAQVISKYLWQLGG